MIPLSERFQQFAIVVRGAMGVLSGTLGDAVAGDRGRREYSG
ncbi:MULTISPECIES: hypothetical protein [unclassified Streptomyces]|nr:hypothetical protein [Streptomyces sp. BK208]